MGEGYLHTVAQGPAAPTAASSCKRRIRPPSPGWERLSRERTTEAERFLPPPPPPRFHPAFLGVPRGRGQWLGKCHGTLCLCKEFQDTKSPGRSPVTSSAGKQLCVCSAGEQKETPGLEMLLTCPSLLRCPFCLVPHKGKCSYCPYKCRPPSLLPWSSHRHAMNYKESERHASNLDLTGKKRFNRNALIEEINPPNQNLCVIATSGGNPIAIVILRGMATLILEV